MKTLNQVHKKYVGKVTPFAHWIKAERYWYNKTKPVDYNFEEFVNEKYKLNGKKAWFAADGDGNPTDEVSDKNKGLLSWISEANDFVGNAASIYGSYASTHNDTVAQQDNDTKNPDNKILGLKPVLFYGILGIIVVGGGIAIYKTLK